MEAWFQYAQEQGCAVNAMHEARMDLAHLFPDLEDPTDEGQGREGTKVFDLYRQIERDLKHFRRLIWVRLTITRDSLGIALITLFFAI